jgi:GNAT superfamily N-acetyltransferase
MTRYLRIARRRFWRRWDELIFVFQDPGGRPRALPKMAVTFATITADTVTADAEIPELPLVDRHEVMRRLHTGHACFVAIADGRVVQYAWLGFGVWQLGDIGIEVALSETEAYLYDVYALPEFRGNRVFLALISAIGQFCHERRMTAIYTRIRRRNVAALVGPRFFGTSGRLELQSMRVLSGLYLYDAKVVQDSGDLLKRFTDRSTKMKRGVFWWRAPGRFGVRLNLPFGTTITRQRAAESI